MKISSTTMRQHRRPWLLTTSLFCIFHICLSFVQQEARALQPNFTPRRSQTHQKHQVSVIGPYDDPPKSRIRKLLGLRWLFRDSSTLKVSRTAPAVAAAPEKAQDQEESLEEPKDRRYNITTLPDLESYYADEERRFRNDKGEINYGDLLNSLAVQGDTQKSGSLDHPDYVHPVAQLIHHRKLTNSKMVPDGQKREDGCRLALAIEGGGMRGCVSAGMICALGHLNLTDVFDVVYGSSAGTIVGAYLITNQLQWFGPEVYYDQLTTAGRSFIDTGRVMRALGLGLLDPRLLKDVIVRRDSGGKPILNLPFLLKRTVQRTKPLDWEKFVQMQKVQPLKVVASGLKSEKAVVMDMKKGHFDTLEELTDCMHASCLLPGIAGPLMNLDTTLDRRPAGSKKLIMKNNIAGEQYEPLADALVSEPLPYRSAVEEGATHVLVIRSRPDGKDVTGKSSFFEDLIYRRFFLRKNRLPRIYEFFRKQLHKKLYAEDIIILNNDAESERDPFDTSVPHLMTIAAAPGSAEVTRLETGRKPIFDGFRRGFARAYDCLVQDPAERGRGAQVAEEFFPDEILDYDPLEISNTEESAFGVYMRKHGIVPKAWRSTPGEKDDSVLQMDAQDTVSTADK